MRLGPRSLVAAVASGVLVAGACVTVATAAQAAATLISTNKPVDTSSNESALRDGPKAVDGNGASRCSSRAGSDAEWIRIDLGASYHVSRTVLHWATAYGRS